MMQSKVLKLLVIAAGLGALATAGCGGAQTQETTHTTHTDDAHDTDVTHAEPHNDGVAITGLLGTLSRSEVQRGIDPLIPGLESCFATNLSRADLLAGHVELMFRIGPDGSVRWAYPHVSDVGDTTTETCLSTVGARGRFPRPHGGDEAEFTFPLDYPLPDDVRPPAVWDEARVASLVSSNAAAVRSACQLEDADLPVSVTVLVDRGGRVARAGAAVARAETFRNQKHVCVAQQVASWRMPDPGSYPAKVTFSLR